MIKPLEDIDKEKGINGTYAGVEGWGGINEETGAYKYLSRPKKSLQV